MHSNRLRGYQYPSPPPACPPLLRTRTALPAVECRLTPLFEGVRDAPVLPVPFVVRSRPVHFLLQRGGTWRPLPRLSQFDTSLGRVVAVEDLLSPATSPPQEYLIIVFKLPDRREEVRRITPRKRRAFVSVYDVLSAVQRAVRAAERQPLVSVGGYQYYTESLRRASGTWYWKGLAEVQDETDVWAL